MNTVYSNVAIQVSLEYLGCVRLVNPDLDFQNLNPDFPIEREIRKRISQPTEIRPQGGFQLRNPNTDFLDFPLCSSIGKSEKGFAKLFS